MVTQIPCLALFARDWNNVVTTDASGTGFGTSSWQKQTDKIIRPMAFTSRYLNNVEKIYSMGLPKFCFYLYGEVVYLYIQHQALEPIIKENRAYRQYNAWLTRWLERLAHSDVSIKYTADKNLKFIDCLSGNPIEELPTEEKSEENYVIKIFWQSFKLNHKNGHLLNNRYGQNKSIDWPINEHSFNDEPRANQIIRKFHAWTNTCNQLVGTKDPLTTKKV